MTEISLVKSPANRKKFIVFKSQNKAGRMPKTEHEAQDDDAKLRDAVMNVDSDTMAPIAKAVEGLRPTAKAMGAGAEDDTSAAAESAGLSPQAQTQLKAIGRIIASNSGGITASDIVAVCQAAGIDCSSLGMDDADDPEAEDPQVDGEDGADDDAVDEDKTAEPTDDDSQDAGADESSDAGVEMLAKKPDGVSDSEHADAMEKAKLAYKQHLGSKKPDGKDDADKPAKPFPGAGKKVQPTMKSEKEEAPEAIGMREIQKAQKVLEETNQLLVTENAKLAQAIKEERDHRVLKSMEAECEAEFRNLGIETGKIARVLKSRKDAGDAEGHDDLVAILKAANAQAGLAKVSGGNMFAAVGKSATSAAAGTAEQRLEALVDEAYGRVTKSGDKRARHEVALEVYQTPAGRDLFNQSIRERN